MKLEAKVGLLILLALVGLFALSAQISSVSYFGKSGYEVYAPVSSASGLDENAKVKVAGVEVGYVKSIGLRDNKPLLTLFVYDNVKLSTDSIVEIVQESMLGLKYVQIVPGFAQNNIAPGGYLEQERKVADFTQAANSINIAAAEFAGFIQELRSTLNPEARQNLQAAIANFNNMAINMSSMGSEFTTAGRTVNERLPRIMAQIDDLSREFAQTGKDINKRLPDIMDRFAVLEKDLQVILEENRKPLNNALNSVDTFFKNGNDTLQKVDDYITRQTSGELTIYAQGAKYTNYSGGMFAFGADYSPSPTNHYIIGMESTPNFTLTNSQGQYTAPPPHTPAKNYVDAMFGKRMSDFRLRGGLIQSTGGIGADYYAFNDNFKTSLDLFDFGAVNDIRGTNPHARATFSYKILKHIELLGGMDNFLNSKAYSGFLGVGLRFKDDDLKYMIGSGSSFIK